MSGESFGKWFSSRGAPDPADMFRGATQVDLRFVSGRQALVDRGMLARLPETVQRVRLLLLDPASSVVGVHERTLPAFAKGTTADAIRATLAAVRDPGRRRPGVTVECRLYDTLPCGTLLLCRDQTGLVRAVFEPYFYGANPLDRWNLVAESPGDAPLLSQLGADFDATWADAVPIES